MQAKGGCFINNTLGSFLHFFFFFSSSSLWSFGQTAFCARFHFIRIFIFIPGQIHLHFTQLPRQCCVGGGGGEGGGEGVEVEGSGAYLMASFVCGCSFWTSSTDNASEILSNECLMLPVCAAGQLRGRTSVCKCVSLCVCVCLHYK